ncbi:MAG: branched-chain amino acid aminotransferase [Bacteroidia bacterium]
MTYEIKTEKVKTSRLPEVDLKNIVFGRIFTDHMLVADYADGDWQEVKIMPFQNLSLSPATTALHYGQEIFEGLKAYRGVDGKVYLFRPYENLKRMNKSAIRMAMPEIPEEIFMEGIRRLVEIDKDWIPNEPGCSLYIRPFMIATDEYVGIKVSEHYKFVAFCSPVTSYYAEPIKVKIEPFYVRATEGGTGEAKCAGNYAASLYAVNKARQLGYTQMLWTDAKEHKYIEESGTMNVFFVIGDKIITPPLTGTILHGITRNSVLTLLRENEFKVEERKITIDEIVEAYRNGTLKEAFGAGTAATIAMISAIGLEDEEMVLPPVEQFHTANFLLETLDKIKHAEIPDTHNWLFEVTGNE